VGDTLVLNADYIPPNMVTWQEAMSLICRDSAHVISEYKEWTVRSAHSEWVVPCIVVLKERVSFKPKIALGRENIFIRDNYQCQYCGHRAKRLTLDHVVPRSKGGPNS